LQTAIFMIDWLFVV